MTLQDFVSTLWSTRSAGSAISGAPSAGGQPRWLCCQCGASHLQEVLNCDSVKIGRQEQSVGVGPLKYELKSDPVVCGHGRCTNCSANWRNIVAARVN